MRFNLLQIIVICFLLIQPSHAHAEKTVLLINSYHTAYNWVLRYSTAFAEEVGDAATVYTYDMDTKRLPDAMFNERARSALAGIDRLKPDVIVTGDDNALSLLGQDITNRGYPLVYLGINNNPREYLKDTSKATGVLERPLLKRSLIFLREIIGKEFDRCLVLFDVSTTSSVIRTTVFKNKGHIVVGDIEVSLRRTNDWTEWRNIVLKAKQEGYDAIILGLYHRLKNDAGEVVPSGEVLRWTSANTPIPPFGFWANNIGFDRAVGGLVLAPEPQGRTAADMVKKILNGAEINTILPVIAEQGQFLFSQIGLERWDIDLPEGIREQAQFID